MRPRTQAGMRHTGRRAGRFAMLLAVLALALPALHPATATALEDQDINVRRMVLSETRIPAGAQQLFQVTLANTSKEAVTAGLRAEVRDDRDRRVGSPMTRRVNLPAKDEERFLFKFRAPEGQGDYAVRFEVLSADYKRPLIPGGPVFFSPFTVGQGPPRPRPAAAQQQARVSVPSFIPPSGLSFERPDLLWENLTISPSSLLLGETLHIRADLRNVGGDLARDVRVAVSYYNTRTPGRIEQVSETTVQVLAPGDKLEMEFDTVLPDNAVLGEYRVSLTADVADTIDELDEGNNQVTSDAIRLSRIKLIFPEPGFAFEEQGLFLFRWDSLRFDEFKVQVGTSPAFTDESNFFDLPQGDKWSKEKEIVPLEGELPAMAQGLLEKTGSRQLYWRVEGRDKENHRGFSEVRPFTITPEPKPTETGRPSAPATGPATTPPNGGGQPAAAPGGEAPAGGQPAGTPQG